VAVPITIALPSQEPPPPPAEPAGLAAAPVVAPEPVAEAAVEPPPEPIAVKPPPPPAPKGPKALLAQAARLRERGEIEKALDLFGQVSQADPENVGALTGRGLCYLELERYPPAEASFEAALGIRADEPEALLGLAETYRWQGKKADAIRYYERYLAAHPEGEEAAVARNALEELRK
jgi:tetratricopeptide (TPR) repeat protein